MSNDTAWFKSWFDTPYYHILYQHRDDNEARFFIKNLVKELQPPLHSHILDLACGRGRHAKFLSEQGFEVTGLDLSERNIQFAKEHLANEDLHFEVGDMRKPFGKNRFDYIFNLFTSFGYFENKEDNLQSLKMMKQALKQGGNLILDFMNVHKVELGLVKEEVRQADGIEFHIQRFIRDGMVIKEISFEDGGEKYQYEEKVQLLTRDDFEELFAEAGFTINGLYGNFDLSDFHPRDCERLILFAS